MENLRIRTAPEQLAEYLKEGIRGGRWAGQMPGESWMMAHLQVGRDTVRAAMVLLEKEGALVSDGQGKRRRITLPRDAIARSRIRVRIFHYEKQDRVHINTSILLDKLQEAGFDVDFAEKSLKELGMDVKRVASYVNRNPADAWVVRAASKEVLEWFAGQPIPALGMFGRAAGVRIASAFPVMLTGQTEAVRRLIELGHRRIVMLTRGERRKPLLSQTEQIFIKQLEAAGINTGDYNVPDWEESRKGLRLLIEELFRHSPPTAMIFQEFQLFVAVRSQLADRGLIAPRDISLVVTEKDPSFDWCDPVPSHIDWELNPVVRRVVAWARNVAAGKDDRRHSGTESRFVEGGTIGPVAERLGSG